MNENEEFERDTKRLWWLLVVMTAVALVIMFSGCKTQYIPVETIKTEYRNVIEFAHDTTIVKDSVWVKEKGDTIYIDRWHTRDRVVMTNKVDSFYRVDTIPQITEVQVPVRYRSGYDRFCSFFMWVVLGIAALIVIYHILKSRL